VLVGEKVMAIPLGKNALPVAVELRRDVPEGVRAPSPITKRASRSVGTAMPKSRHALCNAAAMTDVESISVPSQSKITSS